jgi:hypothetical protein
MTKAMSQQASFHADTGAKAIVTKTLATPLAYQETPSRFLPAYSNPFLMPLSFNCSRGGARQSYLLAMARLEIKM